MKPLGWKKTGTCAHGHQGCPICHPQLKSGRAREKRAFEHECDPEEFDGIEREIDADIALAEEEARKP